MYQDEEQVVPVKMGAATKGSSLLKTPVRKGDRLKKQLDGREEHAKIHIERGRLQKKELERQEAEARRAAAVAYIDPEHLEEARKFAGEIILGVEESLKRSSTSQAIELVSAYREYCDPRDVKYKA